MYSTGADHHRQMILPLSLNKIDGMNRNSSIQIIEMQPGKFEDLDLDPKRKRNIAYSSILSPEMSKTHT